jgi:hypothetical protein
MPAPESMVERVAGLLCEWGCGTSDECERIARAAIEAMREPAEAMVDIAPMDGRTARVTWRAMIDAALAEHQPSLKAKTGGGK